MFFYYSETMQLFSFKMFSVIDLIDNDIYFLETISFSVDTVRVIFSYKLILFFFLYTSVMSDYKLLIQ